MNLRRVLQTLRYLKPQQVYYQLKYRALPMKPEPYQPVRIKASALDPNFSKKLLVESPVPGAVTTSLKYVNDSWQFEFIGLQKQFPANFNGNPVNIDWNYSALGKLWTYNLNYFDFLFARSCSLDSGLRLIRAYAADLSAIRDGLEPYPTSLRIINWIKFITHHQLRHREFDKALFWQCGILSKKPEYHLLGNHLLENGFALLIGGIYLQHSGYYNQGKYIVTKELARQLLTDGAHFEQSPMYHQIILHRLLDAINLLQVSHPFSGQQKLEEYLSVKASQMLAWLKKMTFSDGSFPCFNDAAENIAPSTSQLIDYADKLGINASSDITMSEVSLRASGYRMWRKSHAELCLDVGNVTASYQPGHTHADTFTFCLQVNSLPVIVDTGISTYEKNTRRQWERSTAAHNTVAIAEKDSSAVWGGFRLGGRAKVVIAEEAPFKIKANHDGYRALGVLHQRSFDWETDDLIIEDKIICRRELKEAVSRLHFHPACTVSMDNHRVRINQHILIEPEGLTGMTLEDYQYCVGYNQLKSAKRLTARFAGAAARWRISFTYFQPAY